jgi:type I restriction enzyme R subunit
MIYTDELQFEHDLVEVLKTKGWESEVLKNPTEKDLIENWKNILFQNNRGIDRLNQCPLTDTEMQQILEQITRLRTPLRLNGFINGTTVSIVRDNPDDKDHIGKEISLKIYDRNEIAAGQSRYQIAEQPIFKTSEILNNRRGDLMLLINGMPVIHIELKRSNVDVSQAAYQIEKYAHEGVYTGLFSLVQIFVAMEPKETLYFANPGPDGKFNNKFYFHWADFNNEQINDWKEIADKLLSIPMAHQMIGFYTVADDLDGVLKVMRSYQYHATNRICDVVAKTDWDSPNIRGGYVWHTTGSGKTLTSFKSAQLIANSKDADKVVFLLDRVELGDQSLREYQGFSDDDESVEGTKNTYELINKLKSDDANKTLIVTSLQKMSMIKDVSFNPDDIAYINKKRMIFIIDECHRDTFGEMLISIKETFPKALFFGFTGTPIFSENKVKESTTTDVFGNELHRYSIADGIKDGNVLGFDPCMVKTFSDNSLKDAVALNKVKASNINEVLEDEAKKEEYFHIVNDTPMSGYIDDNGNYVKGIEDYIPMTQYQQDSHREKVVDNILENWDKLSYGRVFSGIFATSSISEAIKYYRIFKIKNANINITCLFDPSIDNNDGAIFKEDGLVEIIEDYNKLYGQRFTIPTYNKMKKDISIRLAHKKQYSMIKPNEQLDLLIVVDQMLTGYDSKWLNTLYLDKILDYQNIIQAFSRTNRVFGKGKNFGVIKYYRKTNTMKRNIDRALKLYSGDKPYGIFVDKIEDNLKKMNAVYVDIEDLFNAAGIVNFERLPEDKSEKAKFVKLFQDFNKYLNAARIQGFKWDKDLYFIDSNGDVTDSTTDVINISEEDLETPTLDSINCCVRVNCDEETFNALLQRYIEIQKPSKESNNEDPIPYKIDTTIIEVDTGKIDSDYMNTRFNKYIKALTQEHVDEIELKKTLDDLHKSFSMLSQEYQKYANLFIHDVESGNITLEPNKSFQDYLNMYAKNAQNDKIHKFSEILGYPEDSIRNIMNQVVTSRNINDFGRFEKLAKMVDMNKAKKYFEKIENKTLQPYEVFIKSQNLLRQFILDNGFDIEI